MIIATTKATHNSKRVAINLYACRIVEIPVEGEPVHAHQFKTHQDALASYDLIALGITGKGGNKPEGVA